MREGLVGGHFVENLVRQLAIIDSDPGEYVAYFGSRDPGQGGIRPLDTGQGLMQRGQIATNYATIVAEQSVDLPSRVQRWQGRGLSCQVTLQVGQRPQKFGSGLRHWAHNGCW